MATQAKRLFALGPIVVAQTVIQPAGASSDQEEGLHPAVHRLLPTLYEARSVFSIGSSCSRSLLT